MFYEDLELLVEKGQRQKKEKAKEKAAQPLQLRFPKE